MRPPVSAVLFTLWLILQSTLVPAYPLPALELPVHALDLTERDIDGFNSLARRAGDDSEQKKADKKAARYAASNAAKRESRLKMKTEDPDAYNQLRASQAKWDKTYREKLMKDPERYKEYQAKASARRKAKKMEKAAQPASQQPVASGSRSGQPQGSSIGIRYPPTGQPAASASSHPAYGTLPASTQYYPSSPVPPISTNSRGQQYSDWPDPFAYPAQAAPAPMAAMGHPQYPPPSHAQSNFSFDPLIGWYDPDFDFSPYLPK